MKRVIAPLLFGLIGTALLLGLGQWQLQRLAWKQGILAEIEDRISGAALPLPAIGNPATDTYQPVELSGEILPREVHVLVSIKQVGAGYRVISPFVTGGRRVLLDRGFVPVEEARVQRPGGTVAVTGNLHWPDDRNSATPQNDVAGNIWFARDIAQMAGVLDTEPLLIIARAIDPPEPGLSPLPVSISGIPNDHLQYALTWFSLAVIWLVMTLFYIQRPRHPQKDER